MASDEADMVPVSVNWHVWPWCNYRCKFCFTTFRSEKKTIPKAMALQVPGMLATAGTQKISFAGGEPTLCPFLSDLLKESKEWGLTTMVISNGTGLSRQFLRENHKYLDWVGLSIDSSSPITELAMGRGWGSHLAMALGVWENLGEYGIRRKLNTVVTALNWMEDVTPLISRLAPERWKVFQFLPIHGENDGGIPSMLVTEDHFRSFVRRHSHLNPIAENNDTMTGSYLMLDPLCRFFQNTTGAYTYSRSIFEQGIRLAIREVRWDESKFIARGGLYE